MVLPWTVNDTADMTRLIDLNVDGLITDYPDRARKVMREKGLPLP
jgi:glycerophosphoryl diester phosphodiesterase